MKEPAVSVGLLSVKGAVSFRLIGSFRAGGSRPIPPGDYRVDVEGTQISLRGHGGGLVVQNKAIDLLPERPGDDHLLLNQVPIGTGFHWQQQQDLSFEGEFHFRLSDHRVEVINRLPLEIYLSSVVASEMSGGAPIEFLKTHAVISRSWVLRRIREKRSQPAMARNAASKQREGDAILRWTDSGIHQGFDVCADDHCQRYRGIASEGDSMAKRAVQNTQGEILVYGEEICDTRYSKCCGGMTERFGTAWRDEEIPYLRPVPDNDRPPPGFLFPLSNERNARIWITRSPSAFCNTRDREVLSAILPASDRVTIDFYRWQRVYSQEEIAEIITQKTGERLGGIRDLLPMERGASGRIMRLRIVGSSRTLDIGKELEIRRVLSQTHLHSSAFVVEKEEGDGKMPRFRLTGAGWGHGVGLCQIGAAMMAMRGRTYQEILHHYFRGARLREGYGKGTLVEKRLPLC